MAVLLGLGPAGPTWAEQPAATVASAQLEQVDLPALTERREAATARTAAARRWFAGEGTLGSAFPDLVGAPLDDPAWLASERARLLRRAEQRAAQRMAAAPQGLDGRQLRRWQEALGDTLDAEAEADAARERLLASLRAGLERAPELRRDRTAELRASWEQTRSEALAHGISESAEGTRDPEAEARELELVRVVGEAEARLSQLLEASWRAVSIPGDPALAELVEGDRQALLAGLESSPPVGSPEALALQATVDRLRRVRPLLDEAQGAEVDEVLDGMELSLLRAESAALQAHLDSLQAPPLETVAQAEEALGEATRALAEAVARADAHPEVPEGELQAARKERDLLAAAVARRVRELVEKRHGALVKAAQALVTEEDIEAQTAGVAEDEAAAAAAKAEARAFEAEVFEASAEIGRQSTTLLTAEKARREELSAALSALRGTRDAADKDRDEGRKLSTLSVDRREKLSAAYRGYHDVVMGLSDELHDQRDKALDARGALDEERSRLESMQSSFEERGSAEDPAVRHFAEAVEDYLAKLESRRVQLDKDVDEILARLKVARERRRDVRSEADGEALNDARSDFIDELLYEVAELPIVAGAAVRSLWHVVTELPSAVSDLTLITRFFSESLTLIVVVVLWLLVRQQTQSTLALFLEALHEADPRGKGMLSRMRAELDGVLEAGDLRKLEVDLAELLEHLLDALAAGVVFWLFSDKHPLLGGLLPLLIGWRSVVQAGPEVLDLVLAPESSARPALKRVSASTIDKARDSLQLVVVWRAIVAIASYVALDLLDADRILDLIATGSLLAGVAIGLLLLRRWEAEIHAALEKEERSPTLDRLLQPRPSVVLRMLVTLLGTAFLAWRWAGRVSNKLIERRAGLAWLGAALARQQLREVRETRTPPLTAEMEAKIRASSEVLPVSEDALTELETAVSTWLSEPSRSLVAVSGDRGMGRATLLGAVGRVVREQRPVVQARAVGRHHDPHEALAWLARVCGVEAPEGESLSEEQASLTRMLARREPAVFVLDGLHRFVIRSVGGFTGLRRMLSVMHATSDRHLWVCGFHGPTWAYLTAVAAAVNLDVFRIHVQAPPVGPQVLRSWLGGATEGAGYAVRFDHLSAGRPSNTADPARARERATEAYWRLLGDTSHGNPEAARCYWIDSIGPSTEHEGAVDVGLFEAPDDAVLEALSDRQLFILTSLVVHDGLGVDDIADSLNLPGGAVRATVRQLEALGVLSFDAGNREYAVRWRWLPVVERVLRTRSLLHQR